MEHTLVVFDLSSRGGESVSVPFRGLDLSTICMLRISSLLWRSIVCVIVERDPSIALLVEDEQLAARVDRGSATSNLQI